jgi:Transposase, Mutator family
VVLAIDGLQPDVGNEVLWVIRECLSGEVLLARPLLSATESDLAALFREVLQVLPVPIVGVISDGQQSLRKAVASALPGVPHQLCQFHYLREAGHFIFEADRHAKKELKKQVRGIRPIERHLEGRTDAEAVATRAYCLAVRSALTDDGRAPLDAAGLRLVDRLAASSRVVFVDGWFVQGFDVQHGDALLAFEFGTKLLSMCAQGLAAHLDSSQFVEQSGGLTKGGDGTQRRLPTREIGACLLIARET